MTYGYRTATATVAGAIAPLDHAARNVNIHITRILQWAPAKSVLLGVPYYGYDWPVTSARPERHRPDEQDDLTAPVEEHHLRGGARLPRRPPDDRRATTTPSRAARTTPTGEPVKKTYRQVYFEDELSLAAKYDYALASGLGGIGIWTLDNDRGYGQLWNVLREKFYAPIRAMTVTASTSGLRRSAGVVSVIVHGRVRNTGTVPVTGRWWWSIRDQRGHIVLTGSWPSSTIYPGRSLSHGRLVRLGLATRLPAGMYTLRVIFKSGSDGLALADVDVPPAVLIAARTKSAVRASQHRGPVRRLLAMHAPIRPVASLALRSALMVALAMTLILVLLPMILSVEASST